jgi:hypothetical protein
VTKTRPADVPLPPAEETILTRLEACRIARIGLSTFDKAVKEGRLLVRRNGSRIVVTRDELHRYMGALPPARMHSTQGQSAPSGLNCDGRPSFFDFASEKKLSL